MHIAIERALVPEGLGGLGFFGALSTPEIFIFIAFLGHFFGSWSFIKAKKIRLFFRNFRKIFGIFHKIHKTPKISVKIGSKTSKWSKFGLILPFSPKNGHFCVKKHCFFENFGAFGGEIWSFIVNFGADYLELRPSFGPSPPHPSDNVYNTSRMA